MKAVLVLLISLFTFSDDVFSKEKLLPNTLLEIKVIKNWEPIKNFQKFKEYSQKRPMPENKRFIERNDKEWGTGQVQSIINGKVTVNFENVGKKVINSKVIQLEKLYK